MQRSCDAQLAPQNTTARTDHIVLANVKLGKSGSLFSNAAGQMVTSTLFENEIHGTTNQMFVVMVLTSQVTKATESTADFLAKALRFASCCRELFLNRKETG